MRAHFGLPSVENDEVEGKPPITVKFEIPYFTVSGIQVRRRSMMKGSSPFRVANSAVCSPSEAGVDSCVDECVSDVCWDGSLSCSPGTIHEDY